MATIKKAQEGKKISLSEKYHKTADSLMGEDRRKMEAARKVTISKDPKWLKKSTDLTNSASKDFKAGSEARKKAFEYAKKKMKNGGSVAAGTKKPAKRVGPVDPKGAFTTVQKRTLAGAKGKAYLTKDKQLGATKMAKSGAKISKKK